MLNVVVVCKDNLTLYSINFIINSSTLKIKQGIIFFSERLFLCTFSDWLENSVWTDEQSELFLNCFQKPFLLGVVEASKGACKLYGGKG